MTGPAALLAAFALDLAAAAAPEPLSPELLQLPRLADEITVTATRTPARLGETAASVTVLSANELAVTAAPALDDALRQVPGFSLFRRSGSRYANPTAQGASLRGLGGSGASRALVLEDGIPLNDPFGGWVPWGRVPRAALERVEVLRGGGSDLYGGAALAGVVMLVRRGVAPQVHAEASYGERGSAEGSLFWAGRSAGWGAALAAAAGETDGYVIVAPEERGEVDTPVGSRSATGDVTLERAREGGGRLFLRATAFDESRRNGTPLQTNATQLFQGSAGIERGFGEALLSARAWAADQEYEQTFTAVAEDRGSERLTRAQEVPAETAGASLQWTRAAGNRHTFVAGLELRQVEGTSHETAFTPGGVFPSAAGGRQRTAGLFAEDLLRLSPYLSLALAARWDRWENVGTGGERGEDAFSPRATLLFRAGERWALTAAAYGGFRAPTLNELYRAFRVGDVVTLANPDLAAERSRGTEAGALYTAGGATVRGTLFWMEVDDTIANVTLAVEPELITRRRENLGRSRSRGAELDLAARLGTAWTLGAGVLLADAEVVRFPANRELEGLRLAQVPRRQASLQLRFDDPRATLGLQARWVDAQFDDDQNLLRLGSYATVDLLAARPLGRGLAAFAAVENLLDERADVGRTPVRTLGPPRLLRFGLRFARPPGRAAAGNR